MSPEADEWMDTASIKEWVRTTMRMRRLPIPTDAEIERMAAMIEHSPHERAIYDKMRKETPDSKGPKERMINRAVWVLREYEARAKNDP